MTEVTVCKGLSFYPYFIQKGFTLVQLALPKINAEISIVMHLSKIGLKIGVKKPIDLIK